MEVFLHKICGQPVQPPVSMQLRRCTPEQAPAVYALQNEVRAAMPPGAVRAGHAGKHHGLCPQ